jgi:hypothetical protein
MSRALERLRPHPHRGDVIAAGAVPLALAAIVIELRMRQWSLGPRFAVVALIAGLILTMAWLAQLENETPRVYHSTLLVAGLLPLALALVLLAEVLGAARPPGSGGIAWTFAVEAGIAAAAARRANSAVCTLIAAVAAGVALEAFVTFVFKPHGLGTFRAMLLVLTLAYGAGALRLRDGRPRHSVQLVNASGLASLAVALTFVTAVISALASVGAGIGAIVPLAGLAFAHVGFGWKLYLLAVGLGLISYAAADREPGPAYIGVAVLVAFVLFAGLPGAGAGSLVGWPLFLLIIGAAGLAVGLRPREPLPPPPGPGTPAPTVPLEAGDTAPPTVPLRPVDTPQ